MNDFELDAKLKSVRPPERTEDYWNDFPSRVRWQVQRTNSPPETCESWLPRFACRFGAGLACLLVGLVILNQPLKAASCAFFQKEHFIRHQLAALPGHLHVLMADEHGLHYLVAEKE
jgi:hypothetical protein